ncbi:hypothetical protein DV736_g646, partial [Chaetothyriales sp. CBS 134916]
MVRPNTVTAVLTAALISLPSAAIPTVFGPQPRQVAGSSDYWVANIKRQGSVAYGNDASYQVFRNVKDYGAVGDGSTDDFAAINQTMWDGNRCGLGCDSSTLTPALVYFPPGTYRISQPIVMPYYTQMVGDALVVPTISALSNFEGIALIDSDPYIPGVSNPDGSGINYWTNQNNFYRQLRNFVLDITALPEVNPTSGYGAACLHWQVAQATSVQNVIFNMLAKSKTNKQQGIFMENGSGGFMGDLVFNGGGYGAFLGNQQFTTRNWTFNGVGTAIYMNWNWLWTFKSLTINDADIGIDMSALQNGFNQTVGSIMIIDSSITNSAVGIKTSRNASSFPATGGTLAIQNVDFTNTPTAVAAADGVTQIVVGNDKITFFGQGDAITSQSWTSRHRGKRMPQANTTATQTVIPLPDFTAESYNNGTATSCSLSPVSLQTKTVESELTGHTIAASLLDSSGAVFERSKPQYENVPASSFVSVKSAGAKGDGSTDDSDVIQQVFNNVQSGQIVYFDHGAYVVTKTINVPKNIKITGEIWPLIMASGNFFGDQTQPQPVFRVGNPGDTGNVEISDLVFETLGTAEGAIMIEWNLAGESPGSAAMWDAHVRIGGTAGTKLQQDTCMGATPDSQTFEASCVGSFLMLHVTQTASAYFENTWFWVADHELDLAGHNKTNIYNGRGVLIESQGPVWLYATSSEHSQLYNYQVSNGKDIFMAIIQTETPYMQAAPDALNAGFIPNPAYTDPNFADCSTESCKKAWGLRVIDSSDVSVWGAGLYSFFDNYSQDCLLTESCQENIVDLQCATNVRLIGLTTKGTTNMVTVNGLPVALQQDHRNAFGSTLVLFDV